jgi:hypothetical protein
MNMEQNEEKQDLLAAYMRMAFIWAGNSYANQKGRCALCER